MLSSAGAPASTRMPSSIAGGEAGGVGGSAPIVFVVEMWSWRAFQRLSNRVNRRAIEDGASGRSGHVAT